REYQRVRVIWDKKPGVLVPTTAISTLGGQNFVYLATEKQSEAEANNNSQAPEKSAPSSNSGGLIAEQRPIKLGSIQEQSYQVVSGLEAGDRIAVSNILSLRDGASIKAAEEAEETVSGLSTE
ncbi:MAG: efflux RND transporter periplasmic adaptor subunit, partial [Cyanobacteria bacterium P01_A01_bin.40]